MDGLRILSATGHLPSAPCSRCEAVGCPWDRVGEHILCPDCQELLASGEGDPLSMKLRAQTCAVCGAAGSIPYLTYPLHAREPLQIDLCGEHFHAFIGRRLDRSAFRILGKRLKSVGLGVRQVFLLHEAFYDERGHPIQPVSED